MISENFIKYIENSLKENWSINAFTDYQGDTYTFQEIAIRIAKLHLDFTNSGVKKGDKISLLGKNSAHWAISYLAIVSYGAIVVPIMPDFHVDNVHHIVTHSDSILLFSSDSLYQSLNQDEMKGIKAAFSLDSFDVLFDGTEGKINEIHSDIEKLYQERYEGGLTPEKLRFDDISNEKVGVLNYTSGTTGFSKGVILPLNSLAANVRFARNNLPLEPGNQVVSLLPLAHTYGCAFEFLWPFSIGCHIHFLTKTPSPQIIIQAFKDVRPHVVLSVPLIIEKIYKKQLLPVISKPLMKVLLSLPVLKGVIRKKINGKLTDVFGGRFKEVIIGGAALSQEVEDFLKKVKFRFTVGYGMTECGPLISYAAWNKTQPLSAGKLMDTLEIKIDSDDPYNKVGEIMVRGENLMLGYYKNEDATKQAIDDEGWLHTGDLGIIDQEKYIYIKGRSKSLILGPSGENIYPEEIEARLNNMPYVQESVVIDKDDKLIALIFPDFELVKKESVDDSGLEQIFDQIKKDVNKSLPKYSQVTKIQIHETEFEKTPKKNIKRFLYTVKE